MNANANQTPAQPEGESDKSVIAAAIAVLDTMPGTIAPVEFARVWLKMYQRFPIGTATVSVVMTLVSVSIATVLIISEANKTATDVSITDQIESLDVTKAELKKMLAFVSEQQERLRTRESKIEALQAKVDTLEKAATLSQEDVDALFEIQSDRQLRNIWWERGIGICIGVFTSVIGSVLVIIATVLVRAWRKPPVVPPPVSTNASDD